MIFVKNLIYYTMEEGFLLHKYSRVEWVVTYSFENNESCVDSSLLLELDGKGVLT